MAVPEVGPEVGPAAGGLVIRGRAPVRDRALVMAIVNRTPDSFYDNGATFADDAAKAAVDRAVAEGADIIDIGGVAASPGETVTTEEEIRRVVPTVEWIRERHPDVVISIDTWRGEVGAAACRAGADLLNDAWAAADPELIDVAAEFGAGYVCTHTGGRAPRAEPFRPAYTDVVSEVLEATVELAERALARGVPREGILIDATGFGKNTADHLALLREVPRFVATGWPVLMAMSNKTFVGETLGVGLSDRLAGTLAATTIAAQAGAQVFRAHEVAPTRHALEMVASVFGARPPRRASEWIA
ncbi:dihydropteroate synthase [Pseudonocardia kunmingensis]|uniref:Dihydropteroate synthase n=2 Tax=Pseudonocardia kunmingensis TaxID=630975 RepID=A0A543D4E4_9PSEU|nr:dihydropteroate synthase [Pseudonocardia kunmingensis]